MSPFTKTEKTLVREKTNSVAAFFEKYQSYFIILPAISLVIALASLLLFGLQLGIDLRGGSQLQVTYPEGRPELSVIREELNTLGLGEVRVQGANDNDYILRQRDLSVEEKSQLDSALTTFGTFEEVQFTSIGPSIGEELLRKAWWAIGLVVLTTILFIAYAFRGVSRPVASWKYGAVAIVTLVHDVLIPAGLFAFLGFFRGAEVGALFIVALLTILGISINDTIVVFDRIRENLTINMRKKVQEPYATIVWRSVAQTIARSINTSFTVVIVLVALFFLGPEATKDMALTLIVGMIAGSYSSIFLASPLLVYWERYQKPPREEESSPEKTTPPIRKNVPLNLSGLN